MRFRLIETKQDNAHMNMAIDEALLSSKIPVLRFYSWKPAGLSIGYFQPIKNFNFNNLKKHEVDIVRRITGGNAVLHDRELTYSFIIDENKMPKSIIDSYKQISKGLLQGLKNLGLSPEMNKNVEKKGRSAACFNDPSWYEILVDGKKIVGSAQKRVDGKLLQHGAVLIDIDIEKYASLFENASLKNLKNRITSINKELNVKKTYADVKKAMKSGFEKALKIDFIEDNLTKKEEDTAKKLYNEKYSSDKWNLAR